MAKPDYPTIPIDEALQADVRDDVVEINRSAAVVKGGRRFSFSALSVIGDGDGRAALSPATVRSRLAGAKLAFEAT